MDISELARQHSLNRHPWELARANVIKKLFGKHAIGSAHILDIGSGDAFVIEELSKEFNPKVFTAIDTAYTTDIVDSIKRNITSNVNFLDKLPVQITPKADCILLLDVLEHCPDDTSVLKNVCSDSLTNKDAIVIITVPAYQHLFSQHDQLLSHYRRYNLKQIQKLCELQGLSVIESGYFFTSLLIARHIQLLLEKTGILKSKRSIDNWKGSKWATKAFSAVLWIDYHLGQLLSKARVRLPGLSVYCICRT
jgi:hypothetical protein